MKKDRFPDIKIEIKAEGLAKKILGKPAASTPSVYGEEQPEGKNLPNVSIKGKNQELQSLLETSNKKPVYTGLVKEALLELRKDMHDDEQAGRGGAGSLQRTPKSKYGGLGAGSSPGGLGTARPEGEYEPSGEGSEGTSSPLFRTDAVKRSAAGGSGTGSSTRRRDPAVFQSTRGDFDMARGPGARVGGTETAKLNIGAGSDEETGTTPKRSSTPKVDPSVASYRGKGQTKRPASSYAFGSNRMEESIVKEVVAEFIQKQTPPMTTSATKPANMGVGMQQPVVTGAGSMKNIDKAKVNKEPAPAAKRKTAPRPRKNIQAAIIKAATLALEKAKGKQGRAIPKSRQFKQTDLGRGATTFTETTEKRSRGGRAIPKSRQFSQKPKRATGGMAETYRG